MTNIPQLYYLAPSDPPLNIVISLNTDFNQEPINGTYLYNAPTVTYYFTENAVQSHQLYKGLNTFTTDDVNDDLTILWNGNNTGAYDFDVQYLGQTLSPLPNSSSYSNPPLSSNSARGPVVLANSTNPASKWWFWLLIIGLIVLIGLIIYFVVRHRSQTKTAGQALAIASPFSSTKLITPRNVVTPR